MTVQERNLIRNLIPDLHTPDHVSLNTKRINFIYGQGIIVYDDTYAVEVYAPRSKHESLTFFAVDRHFGNVHKLGLYYRKMKVVSYDDSNISSEFKAQFDEAIFQNIMTTEMYSEVLEDSIPSAQIKPIEITDMQMVA